jgi:hypothetical protein
VPFDDPQHPLGALLDAHAEASSVPWTRREGIRPRNHSHELEETNNVTMYIYIYLKIYQTWVKLNEF